ncbi:hypothetical protein M438DRAFT_389834 [Aureobasidium pullulans EXF-150]|uniref:Uncharacterized protein n=1 Tax=Aureobasidium pullulans EXF-150 TaxID=1043002 RepID=A0A074WZ38_AURPU|nr:uncharacterized protein M438DRAFT_389834 [Aureobasidium pullulans EXF-150]KEQ78485.1 hypothetical protein M438DRAFT_389834 [Aureobasidium pullulans EXF-150]
MSVPFEMTTKNLSGHWALNKLLSDNTESALALQGVSWITRKALNKAPVSITISQYIDQDGIYHLNTTQQALGRMVVQKAILDGKAIDLDHPLFGKVTILQAWTSLSAIETEFLREGSQDGPQEVIEMKIFHKSDGWQSHQVFGIELIDGKRRHTRRMIVRNGSTVSRTRLVYDWKGVD